MACHNTNAFKPVDTVDHKEVNGSCSDCHNGVIAKGKGTGHFDTGLQCDNCHTAGGIWQSLVFSHTAANYPGDHGNGTGTVQEKNGKRCTDCHGGNNTSVTRNDYGTYPQYCSGCHVNDYNPNGGDGEHSSLTKDANCARCHRSKNSWK